MAQTLIYHVTINVRIRLETTPICRIAETISLLLNMDTLFGSLLAYLLDFLDLIPLLEIAFLNFFDSALILMLKLIQFIHSHIHDILFSPGICDHHAQIRWQLRKIQAGIVTMMLSPLELLMACRVLHIYTGILIFFLYHV